MPQQMSQQEQILSQYGLMYRLNMSVEIGALSKIKGSVRNSISSIYTPNTLSKMGPEEVLQALRSRNTYNSACDQWLAQISTWLTGVMSQTGTSITEQEAATLSEAILLEIILRAKACIMHSEVIAVETVES